MIDTRHEGPITDSKYDYYGHRLATSSVDGNIKIFENDLTLSSTLSSHSGAVQSLSWSHPKYSSMLASGGSDHRVVIWRETTPHKWIILYDCIAHSAPITTLEWAPYQHGVLLLAGSMDGCVSLIRHLMEEKWEIKTFFAHSNGVYSLHWKPIFSGLLVTENNEIEFVTAGADCSAKIWKIDGEEIGKGKTLEKHKAWVRCVHWGENIFTGGEDGNVFVWQKVGENLVGKEICNCRSIVWSICWNEYGGELAVCSGDNVTRVFVLSGENWKMMYEINENGQVLEHN